MSDPLSVTGSAAGIVSLGLTVCQALINYYKAWKEFEADVATTVAYIDSFKSLLVSLDQSIGKGTFEPDAKGQVIESILSCQTGIQILQKKLGKIQKTDLPKFPSANNKISNTLHEMSEKIKKQSLRAVYPFKESTLAKLRETVGDLRGNLDLAVSTLQINTLIDTFQTLETVKDSVNLLVKSQLDEDHVKVLDWLAAPNPYSNFSNARKKRQTNTGEWFVQGEEFAQWRATGRSFIWLHGIPGCGKTVLSSTIIESTVDQFRLDQKVAVAYFYFDFNDEQKQRVEKLVRSLITQLSTHYSLIPTPLKSLYQECTDSRQSPTLNVLLHVLRNLVESFRQTYIILDALDECTEREELINTIRAMWSWKIPYLSFLTTSRPEKDIEIGLNDLKSSQIRIESQTMSSDIHKYMHDQMCNDSVLKGWPQNIRDEIEISLGEKAHGMFRWVACQVDTLRGCHSVATIRETLNCLPKTLDETYSRILLSIDEIHTKDIHKILQWLAMSERPLELREAAEIPALVVGEDSRFDPDRRLREPEALLFICSSLVVLRTTSKVQKGISEKVQYLELAHFSVKEHLISDHIKNQAQQYGFCEVSANALIAEGCIFYLLQFQTFKSLTENSLLEYPLLSYAAQFWARHTYSGVPCAPALNTLSMKLLTNKKSYTNVLRIHNPDCNEAQRLPKLRTPSSLLSQLYYASLFGLLEPVQRLLNMGFSAKKCEGEYDSALGAATHGSHGAIVKLLVEHGADINETRLGNCSPLIIATENSDKDMVSLLVECGADINFTEPNFGTAMRAAAKGNHEAILRLLLSKGADTNVKDGLFYQSSLSAGVLSGNERIVMLLLENGLELDKHYPESLEAAMRDCSTEMVHLLLSDHIIVRLEGKIDEAVQEALGCSADVKKEQIVLNHITDMDKDAKKKACNSALIRAVRKDSLELVELFLKNGADANTEALDDEHGTALYLACLWGYTAVVKPLLENGGDLHTTRGGVFQAAAWLGGSDLLLLLLEYGADINSSDPQYGSALQIAAWTGNESAVQVLLKEGANIEASEGPLGNALQAASWRGHLEIVRCLLESGADINATAGPQGTALHAAVWRGLNAKCRILECVLENKECKMEWPNQELIEEILLYEGAILMQCSIADSVEYVDHVFWGDNEPVVKLILEKGVEVSSSGGPFGDLMEVAVKQGNPAVLRMLCESPGHPFPEFGVEIDEQEFGIFQRLKNISRNERGGL